MISISVIHNQEFREIQRDFDINCCCPLLPWNIWQKLCSSTWKVCCCCCSIVEYPMVKGLVEPKQQIYHCCSSEKTRDCCTLHFCTFSVGDPLICDWLIFWRVMPSITVGAALASNQNKLQFNVKARSFHAP